MADGHLTDIPSENVYSGIFSLRGIQIVLFLAEINKVAMWDRYIGNSYLETNIIKKFII